MALSEALAKAWKADAVLLRLDNTLTTRLRPNGSSIDWNVSFYSAAANGGM